MHKLDGSRLRDLRLAYPYSMRELARTAGLSLSVIADLEKDARLAQAATVRKLAKALGVKPQELIAPSRVRA